MTNKWPPTWIFWEGRMPGIVQICVDTIHAHQNNVIMLNMSNVSQYVPDDVIIKIKSKTNQIEHFVDILRIYLLHTYGGIWMDCDILMFKSIDHLADEKYMNTFDFIGFGYTGEVGHYRYGQPSNWCMVAKEGCQLMKYIWQEILNPYLCGKTLIEDRGYHKVGKYLLWKAISDLNYRYLHMSTYFDGTRDRNGIWVSMQRLENDRSPIPYHVGSEKDRFFIVLYHSEMSKKLKSLDKKNILKTLGGTQLLYWINKAC